MIRPRSPVRAPATALMLAAALSITGCGDGTYADITGTVEGLKLNAASFYHGGPFVVFTTRESECIDMSWVRRGSSFVTGGEAPVDYDMTSLLFTYANDEVVDENVSVEGESLVDARLVVVSGGALTVYQGTGGFIDVTEFTKQDNAVGEFDVSFDNGGYTGSFEVPWCNNLKADR